MKSKILLIFLSMLVSVHANAQSYQAIANSQLVDYGRGFGRQAATSEYENLTKEQAIKKANDLESVLLAKMIEPMFPKGDKSALFGGKYGGDIYRHLLIDEYAKILQESGGIGVAQTVAEQLNNQ